MKVQQFMWRIAHNSLHVRRNLARRGIDMNAICPVCKRLDEDGGHLFLKCKPVKKLWQGLKLENLRTKWAALADPKDFIQAVLQCEPNKQVLCVSCGIGGPIEIR
jgi:hypothetical protein